MTVYVDPLFDATPQNAHAAKYGHEWCHMIVGKNDPIEELHWMAAAIGLKRSYFQKHIFYPHYDLTPNKRRLAISKGAVEISHFERMELCNRSPHSLI